MPHTLYKRCFIIWYQWTTAFYRSYHSLKLKETTIGMFYLCGFTYIVCNQAKKSYQHPYFIKQKEI